MSEDVVVNVGMSLGIFHCELHERFIVVALERCFLSVDALHAAMLRPCLSEPYLEVRVQPREESLAASVMEYPAYDAESNILLPYSIAMSEKE